VYIVHDHDVKSKVANFYRIQTLLRKPIASFVICR